MLVCASRLAFLLRISGRLSMSRPRLSLLPVPAPAAVDLERISDSWVDIYAKHR